MWRRLISSILSVIVFFVFAQTTVGEAIEGVNLIYTYAYERIVLEPEKQIKACEELYYEIDQQQNTNWLELFLYYTAQADLFEYWFGGKFVPFDIDTIEDISKSEMPEGFKARIVSALNREAKNELKGLFPYEQLREDDNLLNQAHDSAILYFYAGRIAAEVYSDLSLSYVLFEKAMRYSLEENDSALAIMIIEDMAALVTHGTQYLSVSDFVCDTNPMNGMYPRIDSITEDTIDQLVYLLDMYNEILKPSILLVNRRKLVPHADRENYLDIGLKVVYYYCKKEDITTAGYYLDQLKSRLFRFDFSASNLDGYRLCVSGLDTIISNGKTKSNYENYCKAYKKAIDYNETVRNNLECIEEMFS